MTKWIGSFSSKELSGKLVVSDGIYTYNLTVTFTVNVEKESNDDSPWKEGNLEAAVIDYAENGSRLAMMDKIDDTVRAALAAGVRFV
jgi:hypothetical protein